MLTLALIHLGSLAIVLALIRNAPEGWQDRDGWHAGPSPDEQGFDPREAGGNTSIPAFARVPFHHSAVTNPKGR